MALSSLSLSLFHFFGFDAHHSSQTGSQSSATTGSISQVRATLESAARRISEHRSELKMPATKAVALATVIDKQEFPDKVWALS
jgi:hypothetical protein